MNYIGLIYGISNAIRGTGKFNKHVILGKVFDKLFLSLFILSILTYQFLQPVGILFAFTYALLGSIPILFIYAVGTGGMMQAFNGSPDNVNIEEFGPFDWLARKLAGIRPKVNPKIVTVGKSRKWGVWYNFLCGIVFSIPFLYTGNFLGLIFPFLGIYLGSLRYINWNHKWNFFFEFLFYWFYISCFTESFWSMLS